MASSGIFYKLLLALKQRFPDWSVANIELVMFLTILLLGCLLGMLISKWRRRHRDKKMFFSLMVQRPPRMSRAEAVEIVYRIAIDGLQQKFDRVDIFRDEKRR